MDNIDQLIAELGRPVTPDQPRSQEMKTAAEGTYALGANTAIRKPAYVIQEEKPEHTILLWMKAAGKTDAECAEKLNYSLIHIRNLRKQEWFRSRFDAIMLECGRDAVQEFINGEVMPSLQTLAEIRDSETAKGSTRVAAANSLLDRALGKATIRVETKHMESTATEATTEVEVLRAEAESLAKQLSANGVIYRSN